MLILGRFFKQTELEQRQASVKVQSRETSSLSVKLQPKSNVNSQPLLVQLADNLCILFYGSAIKNSISINSNLSALLLKTGSNVAEVLAPLSLIQWHIFHYCSVYSDQNPIHILGPWSPNRSAWSPKSVRIIGPDEARPVPLHDRHNGSVGCVVTRRWSARHLIRSPDRINLHSMRYTKPGSVLGGVMDIVMIIPIGERRVVGVS